MHAIGLAHPTIEAFPCMHDGKPPNPARSCSPTMQGIDLRTDAPPSSHFTGTARVFGADLRADHDRRRNLPLGGHHGRAFLTRGPQGCAPPALKLNFLICCCTRIALCTLLPATRAHLACSPRIFPRRLLVVLGGGARRPRVASATSAAPSDDALSLGPRSDVPRIIAKLEAERMPSSRACSRSSDARTPSCAPSCAPCAPCAKMCGCYPHASTACVVSSPQGVHIVWWHVSARCFGN